MARAAATLAPPFHNLMPRREYIEELEEKVTGLVHMDACAHARAPYPDVRGHVRVRSTSMVTWLLVFSTPVHQQGCFECCGVAVNCRGRQHLLVQQRHKRRTSWKQISSDLPL